MCMRTHAQPPTPSSQKLNKHLHKCVYLLQKRLQCKSEMVISEPSFIEACSHIGLGHTCAENTIVFGVYR